MKKVCVIGLGYIGLPTALMLARAGHRVHGVDVNPHVVASLKDGRTHIVEPGLEVLLEESLATERLEVSTSVEPADAFVITVPTPVNGDHTADLTYVRSATHSIAPHVRKGNLVLLESTSPPGTTVKVVQPALEAHGLKAGSDFHLAYCPERVMPGKILTELVENDRVVGGIDPASAEVARELYASFVKGCLYLTDATTAEMVKLMENTFRDLNIALANEFARVADHCGVNVWEAIRLANCHPRVNILRPGPGVGGHCIAVDPWFLVEAAPEQAKLIKQARLINDGMPALVARKVLDLLQERCPDKPVPQRTAACLGLTYKANIDDVRESPAMTVVEQLIASGVKVKAFDPYVQAAQILPGAGVATLEEALKEADVALVLVDHTQFSSIQSKELPRATRTVVLDTRNCLEREAWEEAGYEVHSLFEGWRASRPRPEAVGA